MTNALNGADVYVWFYHHRKLVVVSIFQPRYEVRTQVYKLMKIKECENRLHKLQHNVWIEHAFIVCILSKYMYLYKCKPSETRATYLLPSYCLHSLMFSIPFKDLHRFSLYTLECAIAIQIVAFIVWYIAQPRAGIVLYSSFVVSFI